MKEPGAESSGQPPPADPLPVRFSLRFGGYLGGQSTVQLRGGTLLLSHVIEPALAEHITPKVRRWQQFRQRLDALGVWHWKKEYPNPEVCDGTQWEVVIEYRDRRIESSGSNAFSDADGKPQPEWTGTFGRFLEAVEHLLGGRKLD